MFDISSFRLVSLGVVSENKKRGTKIASVVPIELLTEVADDITAVTEELTTKGLDTDSQTFKVIIERAVSIDCEWIGAEYRQTSPDVRRGETVAIYQVSNTDKYYWDTLGRNSGLRRLESVVWSFSADPNNDDTDMDRNNSYVLEVSSHDKHISLTTSDKNGEAAKYTIQLNLKKGIALLEDNHGNYHYMDSPNKDIKTANGDGSYFQLNKKIMSGYAATEINFKTKTLNVDATTINLDGTTINESSTNHNIETTTFKRSGSSHSISGPQEHSSPVTFPSFSAVGGGSGSNSISGAISQSGGTMTIDAAEINTLKATTASVDNITWAAASGPLP